MCASNPSPTRSRYRTLLYRAGVPLSLDHVGSASLCLNRQLATIKSMQAPSSLRCVSRVQMVDIHHGTVGASHHLGEAATEPTPAPLPVPKPAGERWPSRPSRSSSSIASCSIGRNHQWPSVAISGHQWSSEVISGHQWPSVAISGHQRSSVAISGHQLTCSI